MEDSFPLSPMQQGMLFHTLSAPKTGVYIEQIVCALREELDTATLKRAWQRVIGRHPILRTSFRWNGVAQPLQEVWREVALPWREQDWSDMRASERHEALQTFLRTDRKQTFELTQAPLLRLTLFRLGDSDYHLVWTFHHALLDGRSFQLVLREVFAFYEAFRRGVDHDPPAPRPYRDYIEWLQRQDFTQAEPFWRERLKGFRTPTPFVVGRPAADHSVQGDCEIHLARETTTALRSLAQNNALTLNTVIQGAWGLLLSRYSGEETVVFGATRACRASAVEEANSMVGLFINTLPVRVRVTPEIELLPWLKELRQQWVAMRDHEHTPLLKVQSWSEMPAGTTLFESIVVFETYHLNRLLRAEGGDWLNREFRLIEQPSYPLTLAVCAGEELSLRMEFNRARFDGETIERMLGHLKKLLEGMAAHPQQRLGELPLLTRGERVQLLEQNESRDRFPADACLHQLFEGQVARTPDAVAVICKNERITYQELNGRANRLAYQLQQHGVGPEVRVGLCTERSVEMIVGILAILKAGGAYVPIDLTYPQERVAFVLEDSQAMVLLTQEKLAPSLPTHQARIICIDAPDFTPLHRQFSTNPISGVAADSLAYVIYTSGSTGKPKGVMVTHHNVVRLFQATRDYFHFGERDIWTLFHSYAFDFSVWEIWGALLHGGRLVIVPYLVSRWPEAFYDLLIREGVTVLNQTPSAFRQLIRVEQKASVPPELALRLVILGGEALNPSTLKPWFARHGDRTPQLVNMYGITETTVHVTYRLLTKDDLQAGSVIGMPIPDLQLYILDKNRQPVPLGVPGEIFVGGAGLARGYLNRPELTDECFVPHPFSEQQGARLYKTGDLARFLSERDVEYLGRVDDQVKIRGFRIEPGEIESVLYQHPALREAVVVAREDKPGDRRLVAYVVARSVRPDVDELRGFLKAQLPDYMVPAAIVFLEELPLTSNGKADRRALPAPGLDRREDGKAFAPPRTKLECTIAAIWQELLGAKRVGLDDNFFEIGGHSLLLVQLHDRLRTALNREVPITRLFQYPTISALTRHLSDTRSPSLRRLQERIQRMREQQELNA